LSSGDSDNRERAADRRAQRLAADASVRVCDMEIQRVDGQTELVLAGEFDASCVERFERLIRDAVAQTMQRLVIDMRNVSFIDSTGLAQLLRAEAASRQAGFELQIVRSSAAAVMSALEASGLERVLPFVDGQEPVE
jgi:anti-sigma B factor antagonist